MYIYDLNYRITFKPTRNANIHGMSDVSLLPSQCLRNRLRENGSVFDQAPWFCQLMVTARLMLGTTEASSVCSGLLNTAPTDVFLQGESLASDKFGTKTKLIFAPMTH